MQGAADVPNGASNDQISSLIHHAMHVLSGWARILVSPRPKIERKENYSVRSIISVENLVR
jgi:hypothetical protein